MLPVASTLATMLARSVVSVWRQCHCAIVVVQSRPATCLQSSLARPPRRGVLASGLHAEVDPREPDGLRLTLPLSATNDEMDASR